MVNLNKSIPVKCNYCNKKKYITPFEFEKKERHFCNQECYIAYCNIHTNCTQCDRPLLLNRSVYEKSNVRFCGDICEDAYKLTLKMQEEDLKVRAKKKLGSSITFTCPHCKGKKTMYRSTYKQRKTPYCSQACIVKVREAKDIMPPPLRAINLDKLNKQDLSPMSDKQLGKELKRVQKTFLPVFNTEINSQSNDYKQVYEYWSEIVKRRRGMLK